MIKKEVFYLEIVLNDVVDFLHHTSYFHPSIVTTIKLRKDRYGDSNQ